MAAWRPNLGSIITSVTFRLSASDSLEALMYKARQSNAPLVEDQHMILDIHGTDLPPVIVPQRDEYHAYEHLMAAHAAGDNAVYLFYHRLWCTLVFPDLPFAA